MAANNIIKVFVIDDSLVFDKFLSEELPKVNPNIQVIGYSTDPLDALRKIPQLKPDVITLDVEMPRMDGISFLKELLPKHPIPVILVSSLNVNVFDALSYGAVDFVKKPDMSRNYNAQIFAQSLVSKIIIASRATVHQPKASSSHTAASSQTATPLSYSSMLIAIGASTGGTEATVQILKELPGNLPGILITQHMPEGFTKMYADRLDKLCQMEVREAKDGDIIHPGLALVAPGGDLQMKVIRDGNRYRIRCYPDEKVSGHRPSVDVLFNSVAEAAGQKAVGIILTGMGQDGAYGLLNMRKKGAYTIGQDKESCVVYGMPMVAHQIGGVSTQASCQNIASVLMTHLRKL